MQAIIIGRNGGVYDQLEVQFKTSNSYQKYVDWDLFETLVKGVMQTKDDLDNIFIKLLPADISDVNPIELAVLRLGCYELKYCPDTPFKVVISEYVDLAHEFGAQLGEKFVNSVLDKGEGFIIMTIRDDYCFIILLS